MRATFILLFLAISLIGAVSDAEKQIEYQFEAIRNGLASHSDMKFLIHGSSGIPADKLSEVFKVGNYVIKSAKQQKGDISGVVEFVLFGKKRTTKVTLLPEPQSKSGWTAVIKVKKDKEQRNGLNGDDDCEWWGCIDG